MDEAAWLRVAERLPEGLRGLLPPATATWAYWPADADYRHADELAALLSRACAVSNARARASASPRPSRDPRDPVLVGGGRPRASNVTRRGMVAVGPLEDYRPGPSCATAWPRSRTPTSSWASGGAVNFLLWLIVLLGRRQLALPMNAVEVRRHGGAGHPGQRARLAPALGGHRLITAGVACVMGSW